MEMTLPQPLQLAANQVADAVHQAATRPPAIVPVATLPATPPPTDQGTCYTPEIPGTPSIPGSPYPCP